MNIAIVEPSSSGTALIEADRKLGKSVHAFSADTGDRLLGEHIRHNIASLTRVETNDPGDVYKAVSRLHAAIGLKAIVPGFEYVVDVTAAVAERMGLPGLPVQAARCTRNKLSIRHAMRYRGLAGPAYAAITGPEDLESAAAHVGFPAVLKPVDGSGSLMVRRVDDIKELRNAYRKMTQQRLVDMGRTVGMCAMLESYIAGREFSIEGVVNSDGPHVVAVTEKLLGPEPYFVEMGHVVEADIRADERAALVAYVTNAVRAIGLTLGVFHAEARLSDSGPVLMEIAARLGGDRIYRLVELAKSISLPELMIRSYCGENCPIRVDAERHQVAGVRFLTLEGSTDRFEFVHGVDQVRTMGGCQKTEIYYESGHRIPAAVDFRGRIGHVLFTAPDRTALEERLQRAGSAVRFLPPSL
jgi:biotin carboxylase